MPVTLSTRNQGFEAAFQQLLEAKRESTADVDAAVYAITDDVMRRGDAALIDYTRRFDGVDLTPDILRISPARSLKVPRRRRPLRWRRCRWRRSGSKAFIDDSCRSRSTMSTRQGCGSPPDGARSRRPGFTSQAVLPLIPPPS